MKYVHKKKGLVVFPFGCNGLDLLSNRSDKGQPSLSPTFHWTSIALIATKNVLNMSNNISIFRYRICVSR